MGLSAESAGFAEEKRYLTVSELNGVLNGTLARLHPVVLFEGEIASVSEPASGHVYFTVKDQNSQVAAVMWRGNASRLDFTLEQGLSVLCHGKPNIYARTGKLQIIVTRIIPAGEGLLQKKFLKLKAKLEKEGLFDPERKRPLPFLPRAIGIVTSDTGAVIEDIMFKLKERMPQVQALLYPVRVQGKGSEDEIALGIDFFSRSGDVDVTIVGRGGGSLQDLWSFNEEAVVRAVFRSGVPVISGVGHEVDITLCDLAADARAPTPTAAAEMAVPRLDELQKTVGEYSRRLADFERWLEPLTQDVDAFFLRLDSAVQRIFESFSLKLSLLGEKLRITDPSNLLKSSASNIDHLEKRLKIATHSRHGRLTEALEGLSLRLEGVNPARVLSRGYSIAKHGGKCVRSSGEIKRGDELEIVFFKGSVAASVLNTKK